MLWVGLLLTPKIAQAVTAPALATPPGLSLAEVKITGSEFVMLQNNTGSAIADLSRYWLYVFNNVNPLASGVSSSTQQLPSGSLAIGQTILLGAGGPTCGAAVTAKLSVSLNDSGGFLEVVQTSLNNGFLMQAAGDAVSWSSGTNTAVGMISNVPSSTADPANAWYRYQSSPSPIAYSWQKADVDTTNACQLDVTISGASVAGPTNPGSALLPGDPPPATIITAADDSTSSSSLATFSGNLYAPQLTELLPNPAPPQSDSEDEFIEIYNPNDTNFDLTGFKLEVDTSTKHYYSFPAATSLGAKSHTAFFSVDTNLSLSNSGSQVELLDANGNVISQVPAYGTAKEGQSWALANGGWYWSTTPTPNAANVVTQPLSVQALSVGSKTAAPKTTPKQTSPTTTAAKAASTKKPASNNNNSGTSATKNSSLHPLVLAAVGTATLLYALYEYRHDLANRLHQFRRNRTSGRATSPKFKRT